MKVTSFGSMLCFSLLVGQIVLDVRGVNCKEVAEDNDEYREVVVSQPSPMIHRVSTGPKHMNQRVLKYPKRATGRTSPGPDSLPLASEPKHPTSRMGTPMRRGSNGVAHIHEWDMVRPVRQVSPIMKKQSSTLEKKEIIPQSSRRKRIGEDRAIAARSSSVASSSSTITSAKNQQAGQDEQVNRGNDGSWYRTINGYLGTVDVQNQRAAQAEV